ncbi:hypothetical protein BHE74_00042502 [Ensete ventricosum]|nr:hypothetical protein BHE74_00042502 [Ensete ventricosum]
MGINTSLSGAATTEASTGYLAVAVKAVGVKQMAIVEGITGSEESMMLATGGRVVEGLLLRWLKKEAECWNRGRRVSEGCRHCCMVGNSGDRTAGMVLAILAEGDEDTVWVLLQGLREDHMREGLHRLRAVVVGYSLWVGTGEEVAVGEEGTNAEGWEVLLIIVEMAALDKRIVMAA